jgi:hypothetical protein
MQTLHDDERPGISRRRFLAGSIAAGTTALWARSFRVTAAHADPACPAPTGFPNGIELYRQAFENWSGEIKVDSLWTCAPRTAHDVVDIVNWAHAHGYRVRPRGMAHGWSPLLVTPGTSCDTKVVLVDTTQHLTAMRMAASSPAAVTVETGASMETLLGYLEQRGYGMTATPAPGDVTVGGVLAIDGHGTAVPARGEKREPGHLYGSVSNRVLSVTAVVWDRRRRHYVLRTFDRAHPECRALLTHLGRSFLTEVTLQVGENQNLRCQSFVDIPAAELFADPSAGGSRTLASYIESAGRVETIWFPYTDNPWLKVWSVCAHKPSRSRAVTEPYNYPFSDNVPNELSTLADQIVTGRGELTPAFGRMCQAATIAGLAATRSHDLWGPSKNLLLYIKPSTMRVRANGYAVMTARSNIQRVVSDFTSSYLDRVAAFEARGMYPANMGVEIRVTGIDVTNEVDFPAACPPALSALAPRPDHPEWDVAVWFDVLSLPGTKGANEFFRETEEWMLERYSGSDAAMRPEWSKGWAYTDEAAWANPTMLRETIPRAFPRAGSAPGWAWAMATLNAHDPHRVFGNTFVDALTGAGPRAAAT